MKILYTLLVSVGCAISGLVLGMLWAKQTGAADGQGLAGGAIVLGYGLIGAAIAAIAGIVVSLRISKVTLQRTAVIAGIGLVIISAYTFMQVRTQRLANQDPPEAYQGIPSFTASIERTKFADPVLAKMMTVNAVKKEWSTQLPDKRVCRGRASAEALRKASKAIAELVASSVIPKCSGRIEQIFSWTLETQHGLKDGAIELNKECIARNPAIQLAVFSVQQVSLRTNSSIDCK